MDGWADCKDGKQDGGEIGFIQPRSQNGLHHCRAVEANVGRHRQRRSNRPNRSLGALIIGSVFSFSVVKWTDATIGPLVEIGVRINRLKGN